MKAPPRRHQDLSGRSWPGASQPPALFHVIPRGQYQPLNRQSESIDLPHSALADHVWPALLTMNTQPVHIDTVAAALRTGATAFIARQEVKPLTRIGLGGISWMGCSPATNASRLGSG